MKNGPITGGVLSKKLEENSTLNKVFYDREPFLFFASTTFLKEVLSLEQPFIGTAGFRFDRQREMTEL